MAAYLNSDLTVPDGDVFQNYRTRAAQAIAQYGGGHLVRGGEVQTLEGIWNPRNVVVVEFPSLAQARAWYQSQEYAQALEVRDRALRRNLIFVDRVEPAQ
jgi:uncharacterized protein (DUF1330 family)